MGYVADSIQFRTGFNTPKSHFAALFNHVRDVILESGMEQVTLGDWPDQIGDVVTGEASGNDVSLDELAYASGYNIVGRWVFKHPGMDMYVSMEVGLINTVQHPGVPILPRFIFTCGQGLDIGNSGFAGSTVQNIPQRTWATYFSGSSISDAFSVSVHPADAFTLSVYCGLSGFWVYADGGCKPAPAGLSNALPDLTMLAAAFLVPEDPVCRISLCSVLQATVNNPRGLHVQGLGANPVGVIPSVYLSGAWREQLPGSLGLLDAPQILSTDKGVRVAQAQMYGAGAPVPLPLAMVQASFEEVTFRLDLDGSGERNWLPVPAYQAALFIMNAAPPANLQNHCIYALPASDD